MTTDVQCNGCRACCIKQTVILLDEDEAHLEDFQYSEAVYGGDLVIRVLNHRSNGECVHLGPDGCTIYDKRPVICRQYDCRKQFMVTTRNERRTRHFGDKIWKEARKRLGTLDEEDRATLQRYAEATRMIDNKEVTHRAAVSGKLPDVPPATPVSRRPIVEATPLRRSPRATGT